ncbi:hypothetical protein [Haloarchaeobius amylolyticus]|uniref:hypothetical protein n=1 Tax=Haloarchaeobius amylolyticus TaxID=1198296 RepID=UPI00226F6FAF|nr:hypothetical protein [Haloarchaeobius amylolyticus]
MSERVLNSPGLVALVLADSGNETVLAKWLDEQGIATTAVDPGESLPADTSICLVDIAGLADAATEIRRLKETRRAFVPCLLVLPKRLGPQVAASRDARFDFVDELVTVPIDPTTFGHRIARLLDQREQAGQEPDPVSLAAVVESLPFGAFLVRGGVVVESNRPLQDELGVTASALQDRNLLDLVAEADRETVEAGSGVEQVTLVADDTELPVELRPVVGEDGTRQGYLGIRCEPETATTEGTA